MTTPRLVSLAFGDITQPDFADVVVVHVPERAGPMPDDPAWWAGQIFDVGSAPAWVKALLGIRQALVGLIGVDRAGRDVFGVTRIEGEEALISSDERHLDFRAAVGVDRERRLLRVTTVVRLNGLRGRIYFAPVSVLHGPVTRSMAARAVRRLVDSRR